PLWVTSPRCALPCFWEMPPTVVAAVFPALVEPPIVTLPPSERSPPAPSPPSLVAALHVSVTVAKVTAPPSESAPPPTSPPATTVFLLTAQFDRWRKPPSDRIVAPSPAALTWFPLTVQPDAVISRPSESTTPASPLPSLRTVLPVSVHDDMVSAPPSLKSTPESSPIAWGAFPLIVQFETRSTAPWATIAPASVVL